MIASLLLSISAHAAPLIDLLPLPDSVGDGSTPIEVHVLALDEGGQPITDLSARVRSRDAVEVGELQEIGGGLYRFELVPPQVDRVSRVAFRVRGRSLDKVHRVDLRGAAPLQPPPPGSLVLQASPAELEVTEGAEASVRISAPGAELARPGDLQLRTTVGTLDALSGLPGGELAVRLGVPTQRAAGLALLGAVDSRYPETAYGGAVVPLVTTQDLRVPAPAGASVMVRVGGREVGPFESSRGFAVAQGVRLPPGLTEGVAVRMVDGQAEEAPLPLPAATSPRLLIVPPPGSLPADPRQSIPIRILVATPRGRLDAAADLQVTASAGSLSPPRSEKPGWYVVDFKPPRSRSERKVEIKASLQGDSPSADTVALSLTPTPTSRVELLDPIQGKGDVAYVRVRVLDDEGNPLIGRGVAWDLTGARLDGPPETEPDKTLRQRVRTSGGPFEAVVTGLSPVSTNPVRSIVVVPSRTALAADSISSVRLLVVALDAFGVPVADARLGLTVESGDGSLPTQVQTDERGLGEVVYTAGSAARLVKIRASQPGVSGVVALIQVGASPLELALPVSGTGEARELRERWNRVTKVQRVE